MRDIWIIFNKFSVVKYNVLINFLGLYYGFELYRYWLVGVCFCDVFILFVCLFKIFLILDDYNFLWILRVNYFNDIEIGIGFVDWGLIGVICNLLCGRSWIVKFFNFNVDLIFSD